MKQKKTQIKTKFKIHYLFGENKENKPNPCIVSLSRSLLLNIKIRLETKHQTNKSDKIRCRRKTGEKGESKQK